MKNTIAILSVIAAAAGTVGCEDTPQKTDLPEVPADNTKRNAEDRANEAPTPGDQSATEADRTITQQIRQAIIKDRDLTVTAKNVKVITVGGVVTLRGPVATEDERAIVVHLAEGVEGIKQIDNELEAIAAEPKGE